jgi:hypothetical protein
MSDLRTQLDQFAERTPQSGDPFERLSRRRRVRHRNRRITAGIIAIAVAVGGSILAFATFRTGGRQPLNQGNEPVLVFDVAPQQQLPSGRSVTLTTTLPEGSIVEAGFIGRYCGSLAPVRPHRVPADGKLRLAVPPPNCPGTIGYYRERGWVVAFVRPKRVAPGDWIYSVPLLRDAHRSGTIPDLTIVPVWFVSPASGKQTGPYPRGAFEACPDMKGVIEADGAGADEAALRFSRLWASGRHGQAHRFMDRSARKLENWAAAGDPKKMAILHAPGKPARHDGLVRYGCGPAVADKSWEVVIDEGTPSSSLDFTIYLVRRAGGWKVWGSY